MRQGLRDAILKLDSMSYKMEAAYYLGRIQGIIENQDLDDSSKVEKIGQVIQDYEHKTE